MNTVRCKQPLWLLVHYFPKEVNVLSYCILDIYLQHNTSDGSHFSSLFFNKFTGVSLCKAKISLHASPVLILPSSYGRGPKRGDDPSPPVASPVASPANGFI